MNKQVYLGLLILEICKILMYEIWYGYIICKTLMYEFWYDYIKPKYQCNAKLCYMDTYSFIMHIKTEDVYKDIANDAEKRLDTLNYAIERPLPKGKNKKVIGLMKDELSGKIKTEFVIPDQKHILI